MATVALDCVVTGNEARSGEYLAGQFLSGIDPVRITADLGRAQVLAAAISRQGAISADITRVGVSVSFSAAVAGSGQVAAQESIGRVLAAPIAGSAAVSPSMSVTNASFVNLDIAVTRQAQITAQASAVRGIAASPLGQGAVAADLSVTSTNYVSFGVSVQGQAAVSADIQRLGVTVSFACAVAGAPVITSAVTKIIPLDIRIELIVPLCGEHICGTFICGWMSGPISVVTADFVRFLSWEAPIQGKGQIVTLLRPSTSLSAAVSGQTNIAADYGIRRSLEIQIGGQAQVLTPMSGTFNFPSEIVGKAEIKARINLGWILPTDPVDWILIPTTPEDDPWILIPTTPAEAVLVPTTGAVEALTPTDEEDWILIPTTERTM